MKYHNRAIEAAQVMEELIRLEKEMREAHKRGEALGDDTLKIIAHELVDAFRRSVTIVLAQVFDTGVRLQNDNDLTV